MIYVKLIFSALFWGGTWIAGKNVAIVMDPYSAAFFRFLIASFVLVFFVIKREGKLPPLQKKQLIPIVLLGLTGVFSYNIFFFMGLHLINAGRASVIIAFTPILIIIVSTIIFREKLNLLKGVGIVLSFTGAVLVISNGNISGLFHEGVGRGEIYIFLCVISWATYSFIGKSVMKYLSPLTSVCYSSIVGTIFLFIPALSNNMLDHLVRHPLSLWLNILYLSLFGTVCAFLWYYDGIKEIGPSKTSVFINLVPVFAVTLSMLILNEPVTLSLLCGGGLVVTGVYISNLSPAGLPKKRSKEKMCRN